LFLAAVARWKVYAFARLVKTTLPRLPRVDDDPRFFKIERHAAHFIGHSFRVYSEADVDDNIQRWMREAYEVGEQKHLTRAQPKQAPVTRALKKSKKTRPASLSNCDPT